MHTKRISTGKGKSPKWVVTPNPGAHKKSESITLLTIIRDILKYADTSKEADFIIHSGDVLVDKKVRKDSRFAVGLMDVVEIPKLNKFFRVLPDNKGMTLKEIDKKESNIKLCKIMNKIVISKDKMQLILHDSSNILMKNEDAKKFKTRDTIVLELPDRKIHSVLNLAKGSFGIITKGRHSGQMAEISEITDSTQMRASVTKVGEIQTLTDYVFVVGEKKPTIAV